MSVAWKFNFNTRYYLSTKDSTLSESELKLKDEQTISSINQPEVGSSSNGFVITLTSPNTISVQHLNPSKTEIVTEEFKRVSRSEIEEEFLGEYDVLIGER